VEEAQSRPALSVSSFSEGFEQAVLLSEVRSEDQQRITVNSAEFNRVLGGGIVRGSVVLVGGDPGIGKSTLMLQESAMLSGAHFPVLYISGEESIRQTKLRADRLHLDSRHLYLLAATDINHILAQIDKLSPQLVVVDSIQTVFQPGFESSPGTIGQVRECAFALLKTAKARNIPIFLIGHVTKSGNLAGPKALEHMVDVLLHFEGDRDHIFRILRAEKNRFGSTREIGVFEMREKGMVEVVNPSALFLEQRKENISGSSVVCTLQGTRPLLAEIQALVTPTSYGLPQRNSTGIDSKRLALLLAVLEKRVGLRIATQDVFVNVAGGARIDEPSADLGILFAIASNFNDQIVAGSTVIIGEIGLGGEVRAVPQIDKRLDEAEKLGFTRAVIPKFSANGIKRNGALKIVAVDEVSQALEEVLT
jgi:DNA repair protein RadA/Sms